jgi:transcriptional regulator with XRE-family HTH domain
MKKSQHTHKYKQLIISLREARESANLTQLQVAKKLNKHPPHISKIESGERRIDIVELIELCQIYKIKLEVFLKGSGIL